MFLQYIRAGLRFVLPLLASGSLSSQTLSLQQALDDAGRHHPAVRSAALHTRQQQQLLPAAAALPDPVVAVESPTGDFYTLGVTQSFSLPGVYRRRRALQQTLADRAESAVALTQQEVRYQTALAYLDWQYRIELSRLFAAQDTALQNIAAAAERMFAQGQVDAVASRYARLQSATLHTRSREAERDAATAEELLRLWTGKEGAFSPEPLIRRLMIPIDSGAVPGQNNPALNVLQQDVVAAERQVAVEKSRGLPEITLGYMNQGIRDSPLANRFNAGLSIPLWRGQYRSGVQAAKTGVEMARQDLAARALELEAACRQALGDAEKTEAALDDYEKNALSAARALTDAARRMFEGGMTDLTSYLRNRQDALSAEMEYLELLRRRQTAALQLRYLNGQL